MGRGRDDASKVFRVFHFHAVGYFISFIRLKFFLKKKQFHKVGHDVDLHTKKHSTLEKSIHGSHT